MSAQREQNVQVENFERSSHLTVLEAGETPAVPVKSSSGQAKVTTKGWPNDDSSTETPALSQPPAPSYHPKSRLYRKPLAVAFGHFGGPQECFVASGGYSSEQQGSIIDNRISVVFVDIKP